VLFAAAHTVEHVQHIIKLDAVLLRDLTQLSVESVPGSFLVRESLHVSLVSRVLALPVALEEGLSDVIALAHAVDVQHFEIELFVKEVSIKLCTVGEATVKDCHSLIHSLLEDLVE